MNPTIDHARDLTRRQFLASGSLNLGAVALAGMLGKPSAAKAAARSRDITSGQLDDIRRFAPKARRVIFLFQSGGPSQLDLFDHKPALTEYAGQEIPASVRMGQRLTAFTNKQDSLPVTPSRHRFARHGKSGAWISDLLPHMASVADELCFIKSMHCEAINHHPARTLMQTGHTAPGRPSMGSWITYGLGSECRDLPSFMVLNSQGSTQDIPQPLSSQLWHNGFLPSQHQGVKLQSAGDPILYLSNPDGIDRTVQRTTLDALARMNQLKERDLDSPENSARLHQYEMAFRMQASVPELLSFEDEPESTYRLYGEDARHRGTFAANCLLARRMAERGVRFIQLYHVGWDQHKFIQRDLPLQCKDVDQASAALITDLRRRGLLDETLVIWGGEFGRTAFSQGDLDSPGYGRDHHGRCFTMCLAGGGIKPGITHGATDDFGYNVAANPVHVHDLQATILHLLGIDHTELTHRFQGRQFRLTDVHGRVVKDILA